MKNKMQQVVFRMELNDLVRMQIKAAKEHGESVAAYLRRLVAQDIQGYDPPGWPLPENEKKV